MVYSKFFSSAYIRIIISSLVLFIGISSVVSAHGSGASVETTVDGYLIDIGLSAEQFVAGDLSRFDFALVDEASGEDVAFTDVWLRINQGNKVYLATGIHRPDLGQTGISYVFPSAGEYQVSVRYQNEGDTIVEHSFPVTVLEGSVNNEAAGSGFGDTKVVGSLVGIAVVGLAVGYIVGNKKNKQTSWQETESPSS